MADFQHAMSTLIAELTPQPWEYTDGAGTTLTVIPDGMRADAGCAEVLVRVTASHTVVAEVGITTADMPGLLNALSAGVAWTHDTVLSDVITVLPDGVGGIVLAVTEEETTADLHLPEVQRLPLVSALRRATDVARGWEDDPTCAECPQPVGRGVTYCSTRCRNAADPHDTPAGGGGDE